MHQESVEGQKQASCAKSLLRFKSKRVVSRQQAEGQGQATSVLRAESKPAVCQELAEG